MTGPRFWASPFGFNVGAGWGCGRESPEIADLLGDYCPTPRKGKIGRFNCAGPGRKLAIFTQPLETV
jgi:hypothetical protein